MYNTKLYKFYIHFSKLFWDFEKVRVNVSDSEHVLKLKLGVYANLTSINVFRSEYFCNCKSLHI